MRPYTYICSASAQKAELKVMGNLEVRTWGGAGVSVLHVVCTWGAAFEMHWWKVWGYFSRYHNIIHISLRACMHCMY